MCFTKVYNLYNVCCV